MRFVTYNVNSIRPRLPRLVEILAEYQPDAVCVQETKSTAAAFPHPELAAAGYVAADHSAGRWAGVAILARSDVGVEDVACGLPGEPDPTQARWIEATVGGVRVASVYVPNGRTVGSPEFVAKLRFLEAMAARVAQPGPVPAFVAGDMNVCPSDLDVWDPAAVHGGTHVTTDERARLAAVMARGFVDAFRHLDSRSPGFTWWDYRAGHFHKGFGLRIDLALVAEPLAAGLRAAKVDREFRKLKRVPGAKASDHAPLIVDLAD